MKAEYDNKYGANIEPYLSLYQGYSTQANSPYTTQKAATQPAAYSSTALDLNPVSSHHSYQTPNSAIFRLVNYYRIRSNSKWT